MKKGWVLKKLNARIIDKGYLTKAESETARLLCCGHMVKTVADIRQVSIHTIKSQMESIYLKLSVHNIAEMVGMLKALDSDMLSVLYWHNQGK